MVGIFKRGTAIVEGHVGTRAALKAYLGAQLIWDGTRSAFISVPRMRINLAAPTPSLSVGSTLTVDGPAPIYYPGELHPTVSAGSTVLPTPAVLSVQANAPAVSASSEVFAPPMAITLAALPAEAGLVDNGTVTPPRFRFDVAMPEPVVSADAHVTVDEPMRIYYPGELHPTVSAGSTATPTPATVSITANPPAVSADALALPPKATIAVGMRTPAISAGANVAAPPIVVTLALRLPTVAAIHEVPMGLDKLGNQTTSSDVWAQITGWTQRSGYADTVLESDGIRLRPGVYDIEVKVLRSTARILSQRLYLGSTMVTEATSPEQVSSWSVSIPEYTVTSPDTLLTAHAKTSTSNAIQGGSDTYLVATPSGTGPKPMALDKYNTQLIASANAETLVTGWHPRAGHPGTIQSSNGIQLRAGTYNLSFKATILSSAQTTINIYRGSTLVASATSGGSSVGTLSGTGSNITVGAGEVLTMKVIYSTSRTIQCTADATYLIATPV